ncbi:MAG: hypothetical protein P8J55_04575 [Pseudomonadales bacterium]|nr:hypothetical protein [Pseudomonadales bacterium]
MDERCLQHLLSDEERLSFESQGYLVIKDALPEQMVGRLEAALKKVEAKRECDIKQSRGDVTGSMLSVKTSYC